MPWVTTDPILSGRVLKPAEPKAASRYDELENKYRFIRYVEETEGINILRVSMPASYQLK